MALKLVTLSPVTVTTAGTRVRLHPSNLESRCLVIQADSANTGIILVGDVTVTGSNGIQLKAGDSVSITPDTTDIEINLSDYYIDTDTNGSVVRISYETNR